MPPKPVGTAGVAKPPSSRAGRSAVRDEGVGADSRVAQGGVRLQSGDVLAGRFEIESRLGLGSMGQVYTAFDRQHQVSVALKVLGRLTPQTIGELKSEFRTVSGLVHPNLVRLHELGADGAEWFFTMDRVEGVSVQEWVATAQPTADALRRVFLQLAAGLNALHQNNLLHRDLKPDNFLVTSGDQVVILDFGLTQPIGETSAGDLIGTPAYMAPEQLWGQPLSAAADWYALGVVLYEVLTGTLPRRWPSAELLKSAAGDLAQLCLRLLHTDPTARPGFDEIVAVLGARPSFSPGPALAELPACAGPEVALIGRRREFSNLQAVFRETLLGKARRAFVYGPSGIGKTALVGHFVDQVESHAVVLRARCRERESMAYKAIDGLVDELASFLLELPLSEREPLLPADADALAILFPALGAVIPRCANELSLSAQERAPLRWRAIEAWVSLLDNLRQVRPLVLWVDDLQWSDAESALLLEPLLSDDRVPLLFIGTFRRDAAAFSEQAAVDCEPPLLTALRSNLGGGLPPGPDIELEPLERDEVRLLVNELQRASSGVEVSDELSDSIASESRGHPLFVRELTFWRSDACPTTSGIGAAAGRNEWTLSHLLEHRLHLVTPEARAVLELLALGGRFSRNRLQRLANLESAALESVLDVLRAARFVYSDGLGPEACVECYHDRVREAVIEHTSLARKQRVHSWLAKKLPQLGPVSHATRAFHHSEAGQRELALEQWGRAGDEAMGALAFDHAAQMYLNALELVQEGQLEWTRLAEQRAAALSDAGRGSQAAQLYLSLAKTAQQQGARDSVVSYQRQAAERLLLAGHLSQGTQLLDEIAEQLGVRRVGEGHRKLLAVGAGRVLVWLSNYRYRQAHAEISELDAVRLEVYWTVSCSLGLIDPFAGARYHNRHLTLALRTGHPQHLLRALALEASFVATASGQSRRTIRLLEVIATVARQVPGPRAEGLLYWAHGTVAYLGGQTQQALPHWERALRCFEGCPGTTWETISLNRFMIAAWYQSGAYARLLEHVPSLLSRAVKQGNQYACMCFRASYSVVAWLTQGDTRTAKEQLALARKDCPSDRYHMAHYSWLLGECLVRLYEGRAQETYELIQQALPDLGRSGLLRIGVIQLQVRHLLGGAALQCARAARARGRSLQARELLHEAAHCERQLLRHRVARGPAMGAQLSAALADYRGDQQGCLERLEQAQRLFSLQGMDLYAAASGVHRARCSAQAAELQAQRQRFALQGVKQPGRMAAMLAPGFADSWSD